VAPVDEERDAHEVQQEKQGTEDNIHDVVTIRQHGGKEHEGKRRRKNRMKKRWKWDGRR